MTALSNFPINDIDNMIQPSSRLIIGPIYQIGESAEAILLLMSKIYTHESVHMIGYGLFLLENSQKMEESCYTWKGYFSLSFNGITAILLDK